MCRIPDQEGKAYVCDLNAEQIREYRGTLTEPGKNSPYRDRTPEENLQLFREMKEGKYPDGSKVLRAKIDMTSGNINMRDPPLSYRKNGTSQYRKQMVYLSNVRFCSSIRGCI